MSAAKAKTKLVSSLSVLTSVTKTFVDPQPVRCLPLLRGGPLTDLQAAPG